MSKLPWSLTQKALTDIIAEPSHQDRLSKLKLLESMIGTTRSHAVDLAIETLTFLKESKPDSNRRAMTRLLDSLLADLCAYIKANTTPDQKFIEHMFEALSTAHAVLETRSLNSVVARRRRRKSAVPGQTGSAEKKAPKPPAKTPKKENKSDKPDAEIQGGQNPDQQASTPQKDAS